MIELYVFLKRNCTKVASWEMLLRLQISLLLADNRF